MRQRPTYIRYIDLAAETREVTIDGGIDPNSASAPRAPETIPGIKLPLYDHQRLVLDPLSRLEASGVIRSELPPLRFASPILTNCTLSSGHARPGAAEDGSTGSDTNKRREGVFESNALLINLPVGSGKTLIVLALVALNRVPKRRSLIIGTDLAHALLCSTSAETATFPRQDPAQLARIADNAWYFSDSETHYPAITPKVIERITIADDDLLPTTVLMVGKHLLGQMKGYCESQVEYPWRVIDGGMADLASFLIDSCVDPASTFDRYHLVVMPAITYSRADTSTIEVMAKRRITELNAATAAQQRGNSLAAIGRIQRMIKLLLTRQRSLPSTDFLTAFCGAHSRTKVLARLIFDDYDTLRLVGATRPPALSYIYISGTDLKSGDNQFGFSSKPVYQTYARRAMTVAVEPSKVLAYIGLAPPEEQAVLCVESAVQSMFMQLCRTVTHFIASYRQLAISHFGETSGEAAIDPYRLLPDHFRSTASPMDAILDSIQQALNCDSIASVLDSLRILHRCGSDVGFPIFPDDAAVLRSSAANASASASASASEGVTSDPQLDLSKKAFGSLGAMLYRRIYSERMRINLSLLALTVIERTIREKEVPAEARYVIAAMRNYCSSFSFPSCSIPFREVATVALEPRFALSHLARAAMPFGKKPDNDVIRYIWAFVQPKPSIMQLPLYLEFIAPYIVYAVREGRNFGNIAIDAKECLSAIASAREGLTSIAATAHDMMESSHSGGSQAAEASEREKPVAGKRLAVQSQQPAQAGVCRCIRCDKVPASAIMLTCCGVLCCCDCLAHVMAYTHDGVTCTICRSIARSSHCFALPMQVEEAQSLTQLAATFRQMDAARKTSISLTNAAARDARACQRMLAVVNAFYLPLCETVLGTTLPTAAPIGDFPSQYQSVTLDKLQSLRVVVQRLLTSKAGAGSGGSGANTALKLLLYHNYADVNGAIGEMLRDLGIQLRTFNPHDGALYRSSTEHLVVIANDLSQICGFNMEYLDAIVFYSPPRLADEKKQIVCRGQRLGRDRKHKLIILTLFYRREIADPSYHVPTVNDLPLWSSLPQPSAVETAKPIEAVAVETAKPIEAVSVETAKPIEAVAVETAKPIEAVSVETAKPIEAVAVAEASSLLDDIDQHTPPPAVASAPATRVDLPAPESPKATRAVAAGRARETGRVKAVRGARK